MSATTADRLLFGDTRSNTFILVACLAAAFALGLAVQSWLASKLGRDNFAVGLLLFSTVVAVAVTSMLPEASYVFQWPLVFALLGLAAALVVRSSTAGALLAWIATLPAVLIFAPLMYLLFVTLGMNVISVCALAGLLALLLTVASPLVAHIGGATRVAVPLLLLCAIMAAVAGRQLSRFSPEHPKRNSIFYSVNADEARAAWLSNDDAVDHWTAQFLTAAPPRGTAPNFTVGSGRVVLSQSAEALALEPPTAMLSSDSAAGNGRALKLHITSPRKANTLLLRLPAAAKVLGVAVDGKDYEIPDDPSASGPWLLRYNAVPPEGFELELRLASSGPVEFWLGDRSYGLPQLAGAADTTRPADMMATYGSDVTLVARQYRF